MLKILEVKIVYMVWYTCIPYISSSSYSTMTLLVWPWLPL